MDYALKVENLCAGNKGFSLDNVSFNLEKGYIMALVGRMGCGKSTLLKTILSRKALKGNIEYEGKAGFIMEDAPFLEYATLKENAELFRKLYPEFDELEFDLRMRQMELGDHKLYGHLSKGEKVKFQLAFALAIHPTVLLLDEPTSGLDVAFRKEFVYMLQEVVEKQMVSIVIATHMAEDLDNIADYVGSMENGRLVAFEMAE